MRCADLFCGGGGETRGIMQAASAAGLRIDLAAVNHWQVAIETHKLNFPQARSYCQDLATLNPLDVFAPRDRVDLLWASPECTHHSVARGGRPRSEQGRASAWLILKWLSELYVRRVILENVPEFVSWGPLGADGKPLASKKGATFQAFVAALRAMGYTVDWQVLCAADYGDPTTRRRLFVQAARGGARILWPAPSHEQHAQGGKQPWRAAREIIDWSLKGESIFARKRQLAPATLRRIEAGIRRYWGAWAEPFLVMMRGTGSARDLDSPLPTVTAKGNHVGLVEPFLVRFNGNHGGRRDGEDRNYQLELPLGTQDTSNRFGVVEPFLVPFYGERSGQDPRTHASGEPVPTIPASGGGKFALVEPFILAQMSEGRPRLTDEPVATIVGKGTPHLIQPFIVPYYGTGVADRITDPLASVTSKDRFALVDGEPYTLDITFRMLQPHELAAAQGFPVEHRFAGTKTDQVKQIGNAVPPGLARALTLSAIGATA